MMVDVGTTRRRSMTPSRALRIWEEHGGVCVTCRFKIDGARDDWFIEHIIALELGGPDTDDNCGPAHLSCKAEKDAADHGSAAKAKRNKQRLLGIPKAKSARRIPGSRGTGIRKQINGTVWRE